MQARFGAVVTRAGTTFRLWAPAAETIELCLSEGGRHPLRREPDGWHVLTLPCRAGTRYRYRLPDGREVPDPASRAQDGDLEGYSVVVDPTAYRWNHGRWRPRPWHETVFYEIHCGLYGGFTGVARALPRLAALGVTAVELMPVAEFPGARNWGYDGVLPFAPEASYGTPDDLRALVDAAHGLGLMVFLDVVYNHFGPSGNYLSLYAPGFFRQDLTTPWGAAIDFREPAVRAFYTENAAMWLSEYRIDGLRLDAVHAIADAGWLASLPDTLAQRFPQREIHLVVENEHNDPRLWAAGFRGQWNDDFHHAVHVLLTGEDEAYYADYASAPARHLARSLAEGFAYQGEPSLHRGAPRGASSKHLPPTAFINFLQNHDQTGNRALGERLDALAPRAGVDAALALLLLSPGIPLLFMGEENPSAPGFAYFTDYTGELAEAVRLGRRREFARFAAFQDPARQALIPDPNAPATFERSRPGPEEEARADLLRRLLHLRRTALVPRLARGFTRAHAEVIGERAVCARWWDAAGETWVVCVNLGPEPVMHPVLAGHARSTPVFGELVATSPTGAAPSPPGLAPYSTVVLFESAAGEPAPTASPTRARPPT